MLRVYGQSHTPDDLAAAVVTAHDAGMAVMVDLMFAGPGETVDTLRRAIDFVRSTKADCIGPGYGVRLYPGLALTRRIEQHLPLDANPGVCRHYDGPVDLLQPTYYVSPDLGGDPAALIRDCIGADERFFPPAEQRQAGASPAGADGEGYNYNDNAPLVDAIARGARGAYWHILHRLRTGAA
jgi:hypothetical protein